MGRRGASVVVAAAVARPAAPDALVTNVFTHTPEGTSYRVTADRDGHDIVVAVEDAGGRLEVGPSPLGGVRIALRLPPLAAAT